ncbi:MAG TPA: deoxyribose-phosphate aldolase [Acidimicrobiales bacterium]|nr:deoxyribose-phosphate aldolase [Acidimicrobiales bacterium]
MKARARDEIAAMIDHTLLAPEATADDVARLCEEAGALRVGAVCVSPSMLPLAAGTLDPGIALAAVCGFPSGAHTGAVKAAEAAGSVTAGASEIDMVMNLGLARSGEWHAVEAEIRMVREAVDPTTVLKVILESAVLSDDEVVAACQAAEAGGADFVKTSTGFHPAGGATVHAVELMAATVSGRLGVKASGGIRSAEDAMRMIDAGATRLGTSRSRAILDGLPED